MDNDDPLFQHSSHKLHNELSLEVCISNLFLINIDSTYMFGKIWDVQENFKILKSHR